MDRTTLNQLIQEALVPCMRFLVEVMQHEYRAEIAATPEKRHPAPLKEALAVLKKKPVKKRKGPVSYWEGMTPEQRSAEMRKRRAKSQDVDIHPRNVNHPGHKAWLKKIAAAKARNRMPTVRVENAA